MRRGTGAARAAVLLLLLSLAAPARAAHDEGPHLHAFAEAGARLLDGRPWLLFRPGISVHAEALDLSLAPLFHLGLDEAGAPTLRPEDFDALTDYGRILHRLEIRGPGERWQVRAGALAWERLGHGTVVSDYVAFVDPDAPATAARIDVWGEVVRVEALAGEILAPRLFAARISTAPLAAAGVRSRAADAIEVGVLAAADLSAPVETTGTLAPGRRPGAHTAPVAVASIDTRVAVYRDARFAVAPYADGVVTVAGPRAGRGAVHLGVMTDIFAAGPGLRMGAKLEARRAGSHYFPEPFDAYYSIERYGYPLGRGAPKARGEGLPGGWGGRLELVLDQRDLGLVGLTADGRHRGPAHGALHLRVHERGGVSAALHVALRGLFFAEHPDWLSVGEVRWRFADAFYLAGWGGRTRRVDEATAVHRPAWDAAIAVGGTI